MAEPKFLHLLVEGETEKRFTKTILSSYLAAKGIYLSCSLLSKPGQKGGDVRFARAKKEIANFIKQRPDITISLLIDYYGLDPNWPGVQAIPQNSTPLQIAERINSATHQAITQELSDNYNVGSRFIANVLVHEFEALLFSEPQVLAKNIGVQLSAIESITNKFSGPEAINNSQATAPSKRITQLKPSYKKTLDGIKIASEIGLERIREQCPVFNQWLSKIEALASANQ